MPSWCIFLVMARMGLAKEGDVASDAEHVWTAREGDLASRGVTTIECDIQNQPDDPHHCLPAISQVAFHRDGNIRRIRRIRRHLAPRPRTARSWEEEVLGRLSAKEVRA